jgi:cysteine desulfurase
VVSFSSGGQERGLRSGTVPTPIVVGLGEACRIAGMEMEVCTFNVGGGRRFFLVMILERKRMSRFI